MGINEVVRATKALENAKTVLEDLRREKTLAQAALDAINARLPNARADVQQAKDSLAAALAAFDPT